MNPYVTRRLQIHGLVQGVGFRNYVAYKAGELGVHGWVRNLTDGSVEAIVQGTPSAIDAIVECAHRGPRASRVDRVDVSDASGDYAGFETRPTA